MEAAVKQLRELAILAPSDFVAIKVILDAVLEYRREQRPPKPVRSHVFDTPPTRKAG
jgi:hypothetical protein